MGTEPQSFCPWTVTKPQTARLSACVSRSSYRRLQEISKFRGRSISLQFSLPWQACAIWRHQSWESGGWELRIFLGVARHFFMIRRSGNKFCLPACQSVSQSVSLSSIYLSVCLSICLCLSIYLSVCLSVSICLSVCVYLSIYLSVCLSIYHAQSPPPPNLGRSVVAENI